MDVKCERCNTEYEFDDALVSGRGTTVKCTNCGHKFKIRRSDGDFSEDFWNVTTGDGRTLVFTSLRELQRAIQGYLVERTDRLSRGGLPPKPIGQIPELSPFFEQREAAKKSQQGGRAIKTQDGLGPAAATATAQAAVVSRAPPPIRPRQRTKPEFPAPPADRHSDIGKTTLIGTGPASDEEAFPGASTPPPATERQPPPAFARAGTGTQPPPRPTPPPPTPPAASAAGDLSAAPVASNRRESTNTVPLARPLQPAIPAALTKTAVMSNPPPLPEAARRSRESDPSLQPSERLISARPPLPTPHPQAVEDVSSPLPPPPRPRSLLSEIEDDRDRVRGPSASIPDELPVRRRSVGGFIVSAVVIGCLLMLGAVWAQKNLGVTLGTKTPPPTPTADPRVANFLANGEKALADGNLELAKESFDKASALSEKDPKVLLGLARLASNRADVFWLKSRLLPSDAADEHRITRESLTELAAGARKAADDALAVAPDDPSALRAKIDALRISGDRDGARALVGRITPSSSQPESAYVLAALDLAEVEPLWPTVVERLKTASGAEAGPGRARAALVFALVRSGDVPAAKAEVTRLATLTPPGAAGGQHHPLVALLRDFTERTKSTAKLDAGVADAGLALLETVDAGKGRSSGAVATGGGGGIPSDPRELVSQGERARAKGDYERARTLFTAAVDKNPSDSEALAGLAAIAYAQRDLGGARTAYKRVLAMNPNYMPALIGLADVEWESGDKASATKMYKDIVDRYPPGSYPERIRARSEGGG